MSASSFNPLTSNVSEPVNVRHEPKSTVAETNRARPATGNALFDRVLYRMQSLDRSKRWRRVGKFVYIALLFAILAAGFAYVAWERNGTVRQLIQEWTVRVERAVFGRPENGVERE